MEAVGIMTSDRLRKKLRAFHFRRNESQIRLEIAALLHLPSELISFVDWHEHDRVLQQRAILLSKAESGKLPVQEREWDVAEQGHLDDALRTLANQFTDCEVYLYLMQPVDVPEVPLLRAVTLSTILGNAIETLNCPGYDVFEAIFYDLENIIHFDKSRMFCGDCHPPSIRELYTIRGVGMQAVELVTMLP